MKTTAYTRCLQTNVSVGIPRIIGSSTSNRNYAEKISKCERTITVSEAPYERTSEITISVVAAHNESTSDITIRISAAHDES